MLQQTYDSINLIKKYLNDPRRAVLKISQLKKCNGNKLGIRNAEILYARAIIYVISDKKKYRFNNTELIKKRNDLIRRSRIKKKRKKN